MLAASVMLAAVLEGTPVLEIASDSACPSAGEVRAALDRLGGGAPPRPASFGVYGRANTLRLEFRWGGDAAPDVRELPASGDCGERAASAAIVAASWLGVLPAAPPAAPPPTRSPPAVLDASASPPAPMTPPPAWLGLGLGVVAGGGSAAGARVELARDRVSRFPLGWTIAAQGTLPRGHSVGGGSSRWVRPMLAAAASVTWQTPRIGLAGDLGPVAAMTFAWGSGFPSNVTDRAPSFGAAAGLRLQLAGGTSRAWIDVRAIRWLTQQRLRVDVAAAAPTTEDLPAYEGFLTLGWSLPIP